MNKQDRLKGLLIPALLVFIVAGTALLVLQRNEGSRQVEITLPTPTVVQAKDLKVHVAGAVVRPGVYSVKEGDRVGDAIEAAGGLLEGADASQVNLARKVRDEQQINVPMAGTKASAVDGAEAKAKGLPGDTAQGGLININTASREALDTLPGIGAVRSKNIVDSRNNIGAFKRAEELVERKLIPRSIFDRIKDLIVAD